MPDNHIKPYTAHLSPYGWLMRISLILFGLSLFIACLPHLMPVLLGSVSLLPIIWPLLLTGAITWTVSLVFLSASFLIRKILFAQYHDWLSQYPKQLSIGFYATAILSGSTFLLWCVSKLVFHHSISGMFFGIGWVVPLTLFLYSILIKITQKTIHKIDGDSQLITTGLGDFNACIVYKKDENVHSTINKQDLQNTIKEHEIKKIYLFFGGKDQRISTTLFTNRRTVFENNSLFIAVGFNESIGSLLLGRPYHEKAIQTYQAVHSFATNLIKNHPEKSSYKTRFWLHAGYNQLSSFFIKKNKSTSSYGKKGLSYYLFKLFFYDMGSNGTLDHTTALITGTGTNAFLQSDEVIPTHAELHDTIPLMTGGHNKLKEEHQRAVRSLLSGNPQDTTVTFCSFSNGVAVIREGENHIQNTTGSSRKG